MSERFQCLAVSSKAEFFPEEDEPEHYDGSTILWTFQVPKDVLVGAGVYRIEFVRLATAEEKRTGFVSQEAA